MKLAYSRLKLPLVVGLTLAAVSMLVACATVNGIPTTTLTPAAQAALQAVANSYCPVLSAVKTSTTANPALATTDVQAAEAVLSEACPPNPLPTNGAVVAVDLINAYVTIEPLLPKSVAMAARARFDDVDKKYRLRAKFHLNIPSA